MSIRSVSDMAQPYKGERTLVSGRIPSSYESKLEAFMANSGYRYKSDLVVDLLTQFLDQQDLHQTTGQTVAEFAELKRAS